MLDKINKIQIQIDEHKNTLNSMQDYVFLSGMHALPMWSNVSPYIESVQTGISPTIADDNSVQVFHFDLKYSIKRQKVKDPGNIKKVGGSCGVCLQFKIAPSGAKPLSSYTSDEINSMCDTYKAEQFMDEYLLKKAERNFWEFNTIAFKEKD